jgi:hypothetical protein
VLPLPALPPEFAAGHACQRCASRIRRHFEGSAVGIRECSQAGPPHTYVTCLYASCRGYAKTLDLDGVSKGGKTRALVVPRATRHEVRYIRRARHFPLPNMPATQTLLVARSLSSWFYSSSK